jgi:hypothetical protein
MWQPCANPECKGVVLIEAGRSYCSACWLMAVAGSVAGGFLVLVVYSLAIVLLSGRWTG